MTRTPMARLPWLIRIRFPITRENYLSQHTTNPSNWLVRSAKTQIGLRIPAVWSVFADRMCLVQPPAYPKGNERELLSYWVDVQADLSLCWSLRSYCRFCHARAQILVIFGEIVLFHHENVYCVHIRIAASWVDSNEYTQHTIIIW